MNVPPFVEENALRFGLVLLGIAVAFAVGLVLLRIMRKEFAEFFKQKGYSDSLIRVSNLTLQWVGWIAILLVLLRIAGVRISGFGGIFSGLGILLAVALAAGWNVATSFVSGVVMLKTQPFRLGDDVEVLEPSGVPGPFGRVVEFNYLYTTVQQVDPESNTLLDVRVPNNEFYRKSSRRTPGVDTSPLRVFPPPPKPVSS